MIRFVTTALIAAGFSLAATGAVAGDVAAGKAKADEVCAACHGANGVSISDQFPNLAGQYADYIVQSLIQYRNGERKNAVMLGFAAQLTDEEMRDVAAFYASQSGLETMPKN